MTEKMMNIKDLNKTAREIITADIFAVDEETTFQDIDYIFLYINALLFAIEQEYLSENKKEQEKNDYYGDEETFDAFDDTEELRLRTLHLEDSSTTKIKEFIEVFEELSDYAQDEFYSYAEKKINRDRSEFCVTR